MITRTVVVDRICTNRSIDAALRGAFADLNVERVITRGTRIALKPNLTYPWHKAGVTTSPAVIESAVRVLADFTDHIRIVESDGGSNAWTAEQAFAGHDVPRICRQYGAKAVGLTQQPKRAAQVIVDRQEVALELPALLLEDTDLFITMPVPKLHKMTGVSLGFKNQWGCIPDVKRLRHHPEFVQTVIGINKLLRTRLAIFDGTFFLDRSGPMAGDAVRRDLLIVGEVGHATAACCQLMGISPASIPHLRLAIKEGLMPSQMSPGNCNVDLQRMQARCRLKRTPLDWMALGVFRSSAATSLCYNSAFAEPIHKFLYAIKGRPEDFTPDWAWCEAKERSGSHRME